jgi:hypothetical protein
MAVLKLIGHNEEKEIEFELKFQAQLSIAERFDMLLKRREEILQLLETSGHRRPFEIIKRA